MKSQRFFFRSFFFNVAAVIVVLGVFFFFFFGIVKSRFQSAVGRVKDVQVAVVTSGGHVGGHVAVDDLTVDSVVVVNPTVERGVNVLNIVG